MKSKMFLQLILPMLVLLMVSGCCDKKITEPERPVVTGWRPAQFGGSFVLQKGETTENGEIGIKLIEIIPAKCEVFRISQLPYVKLQFYKVSDRSIMCESTSHLGSDSLTASGVCDKKLVWSVIYITAVNAKEGWAAFEL